MRKHSPESFACRYWRRASRAAAAIAAADFVEAGEQILMLSAAAPPPSLPPPRRAALAALVAARARDLRLDLAISQNHTIAPAVAMRGFLAVLQDAGYTMQTRLRDTLPQPALREVAR